MTKADFESAVHEHQGMVYSIALNFFHNAAIAETVVIPRELALLARAG